MLLLALMAFVHYQRVSRGLNIKQNQFYLHLFFPALCTQNADRHWEVKSKEKPTPALKWHLFYVWYFFPFFFFRCNN